MKRIKFFKTIMLEGKPIWYKGLSYDIQREWINKDGKKVYGLISEDLQMRGIDAALGELDGLFVVEDSENKPVVNPQVINTEKFETKIESEHPIVEKKVEQTIPKKSNNKKRKSNKK